MDRTIRAFYKKRGRKYGLPSSQAKLDSYLPRRKGLAILAIKPAPVKNSDPPK